METTDKTDETDESRCESAGRRLLKYLGGSVDCAGGSINVYFPLYSSNFKYTVYMSWHSLIWLKDSLVGKSRSLMDNVRVSVLNDPGFKVSNPPFEYSSLEELELQLLIRGF